MSRPLPLAALAFGLMSTTPVWAQDGAQTPMDAARETCQSAGPNAARAEACTYVIANARLSRNLLVSGLSNRGQARRLAGNRDAAMADFDAALTIDPTFGFAWQGRGQVLTADGQTQAGLEAYDKATRFNPQLTTPYVARAQALTASGDWAGVVAEADRMLAAIPDTSYAYRMRGLGRLRLNELDTALADLDTAARLAPEDAAAFGVRGQVHEARDDDLRAFADYDRAVTLAPQTANWTQLRGSTLIRLGRHADAIADFDRVLEIEPGNAHAHASHCWARALWEQQLDQALASCDEAIRLSPENSSYYGTRAMAHLKRADLPAALSDFDRTLALDPVSHYARYGRGVVMIRQGRDAEGRAEIATALAADPKMAETWVGYGVPIP